MDTVLDQARDLHAPSWAVSAVAGIAFHALVQSFEPDYIIWHLMGLFLATASSILYVDVQLYNSEPFDAILRLAIGSLSFFGSLTASMFVYRAFFHRLRNFPGPFGARISMFNSMSLSKNLQFHLELEKLHEKYGDVVRTGPRELSLNSASAMMAITSCRKSIWYNFVNWNERKVSMAQSRDLDDHRRRRRSWEHAMSLKALAKYQPEVQKLIEALLSQLKGRENQPLNVTEWMAWLSYDIMGVVGFGKSFGQLNEGVEHSAVKGLRDAQIYMGYTKATPWLMNFLSHIPGADGEMGRFVKYCKALVAEKQKIQKVEKQPDTPHDVLSWMLKSFDERDKAAPPTKEALDEESRAIVLAGADTASSAMVNALFFLAKYPEVYKSLQTMLDEIFPGGPATFDYEKIKDSQYLEGIINETLRLKPPVPSGNPRETPPEGLQLGDLYIPGNVNVVMPQWVMQRDERYFEKPLDFIPERWASNGPKKYMVKDRMAFFPFQIGMYHCVGRPLAMMELRSVISRIALQFDISFAPGEDVKAFDEGIQDTFTLSVPPLHMCFSSRA